MHDIPFKVLLHDLRCARTPKTIRNTRQPVGRCPELVYERDAMGRPFIEMDSSVWAVPRAVLANASSKHWSEANL
eukprot:6175194-Pleurochrysis_carterae.AAC.2